MIMDWTLFCVRECCMLCQQLFMLQGRGSETGLRVSQMGKLYFSEPEPLSNQLPRLSVARLSLRSSAPGGGNY